MKPKFYKILSNYLKLLINEPNGIIISEEEFNSKLEYHMQHKFLEFLEDNLKDIGYHAIHDNRNYIILKNIRDANEHWE